MGFGSWLLVIAVVIAAAVLTHLQGCLAKPLINEAVVSRFAVSNLGVGLNVPIYVVGPPTLVQRLIGVGINQSLIRPVSISELPELPGHSLVLIDWSVIGPSLIINESGLVHVNANSTGFKLIMGLIRRGDFIIIHGNSSELPAIELALALAWSRAFNTSLWAAPIPRYLNGLNYVIAYGNNHVLLIGPHTLGAALGIAGGLWLPTIMRVSTPDPGNDLCGLVVQEYGILANQSAQVNNAYIIVYGPQSYSDSLGAFDVDFCLSWAAGVVSEDYNGYSVGSAQLINFLEYAPNPRTQINYLKSFQDAYASYVVYEYELGKTSQIPGDVMYIAGGYNPRYWTDMVGYQPPGMQCTQSTTYTVGITIGHSESGGIMQVSQTYSCPQYVIYVGGSQSTATPLGPGVVNNTWIFTPMTAQVASEEQAYAVESEGFTYMGTAYNPQPSTYTIPAGSSALVHAQGIIYIPLLIPFQGIIYIPIPIPFTCYEHIVYDINWDVWVNVSKWFISPVSSSAGPTIYLPSTPQGINEGDWYTSSGFRYTIYCQYQP